MPSGFSIVLNLLKIICQNMVHGHRLEEWVEKELEIMGLSIGYGLGVVAVSTSYIRFVRMF